MTDVVAQLKLTSKGKLVYTSNWNAVELSHDALSGSAVHITPFVVKKQSRLIAYNFECKTSKSAATEYKYENYYSPERKYVQERLLAPTEEKTRYSVLDYSVRDHSSSKAAINIAATSSPSCTLPCTTIINSLVTSPNRNILLKNINEEYEETLKSLSNLRMQTMKMNINQFDNEYKHALVQIGEKTKEKYIYETDHVQSEENMISNDASVEISKQRDLEKQRNMIRIQNLREAEKRQKDLEEKVKLREQEKKLKSEKIKALAQYSEPARKIVTRVTQIYESFKAAESSAPQNLTVLIGQVSREYNECKDIISNGVNNPNRELDSRVQQAGQKIKNLEDLVKACENIFNDFQKKQLAEQKLKTEAEEKAKREATAAAAVVAAAAAVTPTSVTTSQPPSATSLQIPTLSTNISIRNAVPALAPLEATLRPILSLCCPKPAFIEYLHIQKLLLDSIKEFETFSNAAQNKAFKFELYKVVNTAINAISDESPKHLLAKIMKINGLFTEQDVEVGAKTINVKGNKEAMLLCKELLAKKLVLQGISQVASSFKTAFSIAAFATGIWALFPDVGELLLAHFYLKCPYLIPFYIPPSKDISTLDYCKLVGYTVDGQDIESEDKYLKKLSGIVRLYAAILQTDVAPQLGQRVHPHGIEHGWIWFTRLLNLEPRPSVTATIIYDFLEVAGYAMMKRFGKQFKKLLLYLCQEYLPKILKITTSNSKAAEMRLKIFLDDCIKAGTVKEPEGRLTTRWWNTGHS